MKKGRNSNIELLRIISIIMIVISHYSVHNGINNFSLPIGINRFLLEIMTLGNIGVVLFMFISGYYLINSTKIKFKKIIKLWLQIWCYSLIIYFLFVGLGSKELSIENIIKYILPISFEQYWFATAYIILYIFHPCINKLINNMSRKEHLISILTGLIIFSLLHLCTTKSYYGNELIQFILFYSIGAYFSKYKQNLFSNNKVNKFLLIFSTISLMLSVIMFDLIGTKFSIIGKHSTYLFSRTSPIVIILSIALFNIFINKKEKNNLFINTVSSGVFGVYLISDHNIIRDWLWIDILKNSKFVNSIYLLPHMIISVLITFIICNIIELIRINTFEKMYDKFISKKIDSIQLKIENKIEKVLSKKGIN